jgi:hypothetical protein
MKKYITIQNVCNLSRLPVGMTDNPIFKTCKEISNDSKLTYIDSSLFRHYNKKLPENLEDFYSISFNSILKDFSYKNSFLPWYHTTPVINYEDVAFIRRDNNFGKKQFDKIKKLLSSIKKNGYKPDDYSEKDRKLGHITGYFLFDHEIDVSRFYVVSGNHRAAIVSFLNQDARFPVTFEKKYFMKDRDKDNCGFLGLDYPKCFSLSDIENWPSVKSKFIRKEVAKQIFQKYILA